MAGYQTHSVKLWMLGKGRIGMAFKLCWHVMSGCFSLQLNMARSCYQQQWLTSGRLSCQESKKGSGAKIKQLYMNIWTDFASFIQLDFHLIMFREEFTERLQLNSYVRR